MSIERRDDAAMREASADEPPPSGGGRSVGAAVTAAAVRLQVHGFSSADARREAAEMYAGLLCAATSIAWTTREDAIAEPMETRFNHTITRRIAGMPQAYAVGRANFRGIWYAVDRRVLIPRPETEGLVQLVIDAAARWVRVPLVADIGTGSGAIAVSLAMEGRIAGVIATDVSPDALNVALDNAAAAGAKDRVAFRRGSLCAPLLDDTVDVVVSNLPYVATGEWESLEPGVKAYEPRLALDGGSDGLALIRQLIGEVPARLAVGGLMALETDASRAEATATLAREAGFERVEVCSDLFGRPRYVTARRAERQ